MDTVKSAWIPQSTGWIFSYKKDLLFFVLPILVVLLLLFIFDYFDLFQNSVISVGGTQVYVRMTWIEWIALAMLDAPHVLSTGYRVYTDPNELRQKRFLYVGVPLLVIVFLFFAFSNSELWAFRFVSYFNVYHIIKQQIGLIYYSNARSSLNAKISRKILTIVGYNFTLIPILMWHFSPYGARPGWIFEGDLLLFPSHLIYSILEIVHWSVNLFVGIFLWNHMRKGNPVAAGLLVVLGTTWVAWYAGIVMKFDGETTVMLDILHMIPYLGLTYFVYRSQKNIDEKGLLHFYFPLVIISFMMVLSYSLFTTKNAGFWGILCIAIITGINVSHYILDGFIWKLGGKNPSVESWLFKSK